MLDPRVIDPGQELISRDDFGDDLVDEVVEVMEAMARWRTNERRLSDAARKYMNLGENDMRAVRYLIAAQRHGALATPSELAKHLQITTASVSRMLDRLVAGHHIIRSPHPQDRRSTVLEVTEETQTVARQTVGRNHAQRFHAVANLTSQERAAVVKFFEALSDTGSPR